MPSQSIRCASQPTPVAPSAPSSGTASHSSGPGGLTLVRATFYRLRCGRWDVALFSTASGRGQSPFPRLFASESEARSELTRVATIYGWEIVATESVLHRLDSEISEVSL